MSETIDAFQTEIRGRSAGGGGSSKTMVGHRAGVVACLLITACSGHFPTVVLDTPMGVTPIYTPPGSLVGAPPGLDNPAPAPSADLSGEYAGTAVPLQTGGGACIDNQHVGGFRVRGRSARYGGFRGTIAPDGGVQMVYGQDWLFGQFEGVTFQGQLDLNGRLGGPSCTYMLTLERAHA